MSYYKKEKIKNRDKGKPRTLFSLTGDYAYLISAMDNFADKKLLETTPGQKIKKVLMKMERYLPTGYKSWDIRLLAIREKR